MAQSCEAKSRIFFIEPPLMVQGQKNISYKTMAKLTLLDGARIKVKYLPEYISEKSLQLDRICFSLETIVKHLRSLFIQNTPARTTIITTFNHPATKLAAI